jgi:hypothetical protein
MNSASKLPPSSLTARIAKVRNYMRVEAVTSVSPANEEIFAALCRLYGGEISSSIAKRSQSGNLEGEDDKGSACGADWNK